MSDVWGNRDIKSWQYDKKRVKGCSRKNVDILRELKDIEVQLGRIGTLTYFLLTRFSDFNASAMMHSARNQRNLVRWAISQVKEYRIDPPWDTVFDRNINRFVKRIDYCYMICKENLRLSKHWPYFEKVGFDRLLEFEQKYEEGEGSVLDKLIPEMERWEDEHEMEIDIYMESISDELDRHNKWKEKKLADIKASKKAIRDEKCRLKAEEKQEKEWAKERIDRRKKENADLNCVINRNRKSEWLLQEKV